MVEVSARGQWPPSAKSLVISVMLLVVLVPTAANAEVMCYWCEGCDVYMPTQMKSCASECSVWYSKDGATTTVNRGCLEEAELDVISQCASALCNTASVTRCVRCDSTVSAECETVICQTAQSKCYLNPADGHRGCTLDQNYDADCSSGNGDCIECTSQPGKPCNDIPKCVVCDMEKNPECLEDTLFVQECPEAVDQCYRYRDAEHVEHLGCTSQEDYTTICQGTANCHTCSSAECNRDAKFECYTCDDCTSVGQTVELRECNIHEENRCYMGYDKITKQTHRGCYSSTVPDYDFIELCDSTGCNDQIFPNHLQCYQCVDCTEPTVTDVNYCSNTEATGCFMLELYFEPEQSRTLVRGCNTDEQFANCQIDRNCRTCDNDQCNGELSQVDTFCNQCDGVVACEQPIPSTPCTDKSFTNQCYLYSDGTSAMKKGCVLDLDPTMADVCYDQSDERCKLCPDNQCNRKHCVQCDTRTDGMVCVVADKTMAALRYTLCAGDVCRMEINAEGHTKRDCLENFTNPCEPGTCVESIESGSNAGIFPADRRQCFQCTGESCWEEQEEVTGGHYCPLYRGAEDGCYIYNDGSTIVRGCTTDPAAMCVGDDNDPPGDCTVSLEDLSNSAAQAQTPMTCYADCPGNMPPCSTITCPSSSDRCFVSVSTTGVITRGCTTSTCPADSKNCFTCNEPNCNGVYSVCSSCDTVLEMDCTVGVQYGAICLQSVGCFQYRDEARTVYGCADEGAALCADNVERCQYCDEPLCNTKALNLCYSCTDCRDVSSPVAQKTKLCTNEEDHCITGFFDGSIDRGCRSELPLPVEDYIVIEDCTDAPGCNQLLITDYVSCYVCTDCPNEPNEADATLCLNPPANQCFTRREANGVISRGCANEDALSGCDDGVNCEVCEQSNCNNLAVPTTFSCVQCARGDACADYNVLSDCPNTLAFLFDACVIHNQNSQVMKGCLSSVELFVYCYGSSNNGICTVTYESQGNARPAMCIDCQGDEECIRGDENNLPTTTYFHGSCVSFLDANGMVVRGNVVDYPEYQGSSHYAECFSDVCNGGLFPDDRLLCYQCSGEQCARLPLEPAIKPEPCLRYDKANAKCYTWYDSLSNAQRGCVLDDSVCETDGVLCQDCADSGCNVLGYDDFDDTRVCVQCSSNRACDENPAEEICTGDGGCYKFFLSELLVTAKGCVSELKESMVWYDECASSDSDRCERCYGDYCNRNRCYVCNSLMGVGGSCIEPSVGSTESSTCTESDECVAFIDDDGHTVRGCRDSFEPEQLLDCSETSRMCVRCTGEYCNGGPLPRDRIKCYQCAGTPDCLNPPKSSELYCDIYREGEDSCYTLFQDETTVERGCTLQRSEPCEQPCQQCNTTGCNNQPAFVQNSLSCAQCSDDDCPPINEPAAPALVKPCPDEILFGRIDQCYSYFYPNGTIVKGCFGELAKSDVDLASQCSDPSDVTCKLCTGDGCNARSVTCFVCDTDTFPGCADNLSESGHSLYVEACGTGQCVSVLQGTVTRKGCSEDYKVLCESDGSDVTCETFDGSMSNRAVYPADRLQCFQCQGSSCDVIESTTRSASACQQYNPTDECYTYVSDSGETFRGCISDSQTSNPCIEQSDLCVRCNSELACNNEPAIRSNELICAQCTRAVECEAMEQRFEKCTQPVLLGRPDSCYVQAFAGEILARGCLSDAPLSLRDKCAENGAPNSECSLCLCDRCNGPSVQCVSCEGETGCGGVLGAEAKLAACETGSCVSFVKHLTNGSSLIVKGCSELYERETCGKGQPGEESYQLCHSPGCNDVLFPVDRLKCYQCEDAACSDPSLEPTICEPYSEGDKCYSFLDRQQKGCLGQLENATEECTEGRCSVCDVSDGCNEEPRALECFVCSSKNDPSCVDPTATVMSKKMCLVGGCITLIDDDGYTVRGCANEYDASSETCTGMDAATTTCNVCTEGDACNGALFPANRLRCYQCSGASCLDVSLQQVAVCQRYNANDACYMYATSPTDIRRGCLSDTTFQCSEECVTCTSANGCNDDPPIVPNALTCHHCDGADCAMQQTGKGSACPNVLLGRTDACYTFAEKYTVRRGCLSEQTACNPTNENCHTCTGESGCNGEEYPVALHECILCDEADAGERCKWGYDQTAAQRCTSDLSFTNVGCYTCYSTSDTSALFHRGCVGEDRQAQCQPGTVQVCLGAACNQRNEQLQICAKCEEGCENDRWTVEECRGIVPYERRGCYIMLDSRKRIVARGCAADLNQDTWNLCSNVKDSSCITCLGNECNHAAIGLTRMSLLWTLVTALLLTFIVPNVSR